MENNKVDNKKGRKVKPPLEMNFVSLYMRGTSETAGDVLLLGGGLEIYEHGERSPDAGFSFFRYAYKGREEFRLFAGHPPFFMSAYTEPDRLEFYLPPEIKILNFPLIFGRDRGSEKSLDPAFSHTTGRMTEEKTLRLDQHSCRITSGRLNSLRTVCGSEENRPGFAAFISPNSGEMNNARFLTYRMRRLAALEQFFLGKYLLVPADMEKSLRLKRRRNRTKIKANLPAGKDSSEQKLLVMDLETGPYIWSLRSYNESGDFFCLLQPMPPGGEAEILDPGRLRINVAGAKAHDFEL